MKNRSISRIFSLLLVVLMIMAALPVSAQAAEIVRTNTGGENITWTLDEEGTIVFSGTGDMKDYGVHFVPNWASLREPKLQKVIIEEGITSVGECAFYHSNYYNDDASYFSAVKELHLPASLTEIDDLAFCGMKHLEQVHITDLSAYCRVKIQQGGNPFYNTKTGLYLNGELVEELVIPSDITTVLKYAFMGCSSIKSVIIPETVTAIESHAFNSCKNLRRICFLGDAHSFGDNLGAVSGTVTVFYPKGNDTWTEEVMPEYGGITWIPWEYQNRDGWFQLEGKWYYLVSGAPCVNFQELDGHWYYFDKTGAMVTGWQKIDQIWYYFDANGVMQTGWIKLYGNWYYLGDNGCMVRGWRQICGAYYYFDESGVMQIGWLWEGGRWYYLNNSGVMQSGWLQLGKDWFYLDSSGAMVIGWRQMYENWYYFNNAGVMAIGWHKMYGNWYYFAESGAMATGWLQLGDTWYYLNDSGVMVTGTHTIDGVEYHFDSNGAWIA